MVKHQFEEPRYLTDDEILEIASVLPKVQAAIPEVAENVRNQLQLFLMLSLRDKKVCPAGIGKLKGKIISNFVSSLIQPGESIGISTGEAIAAPITQMNLNTFHQTGSAKQVGIDSFRELFNASQNRKNEISTIHFKNKNLSFEEVLDYRQKLISVSVEDVAITTSIENTTEGTSLSSRGWWYPMYLSLNKKKFEDSKYYLRIYFNLYMLYTYNVTIEDIVKVFENNGFDNSLQSLQCIPSPISEGIIDIYPNETTVLSAIQECLGDRSGKIGINDQNASLLFIQHCIIPKLGMITIKGIPGITKLFPVKVFTMSIIRSEEIYLRPNKAEDFFKEMIKNKSPRTEIEIEEKNAKLTWIIWLNVIQMRITGITIEKLIDVFLNIDAEVFDVPYDLEWGAGDNFFLTVKMPENWVETFKNLQSENLKTKHQKANPENWEFFYKKDIKEFDKKKITPSIYIKFLLDQEEENAGEWIKQERKNKILYPIYKHSKLYTASSYVYAEATGSNLKVLLTHPDIDPTRTICNNPHEILNTLDVEAARNFIARDFYEMIIGNGSYVNQRYISIIADFMTNQGLVLPITSRGIARQNRGAFADASFEQPVEHFIKSALTGKNEIVASTSACIFMGKRPYFGTGSMHIGLRLDIIEELEKENEIYQENNITKKEVEINYPTENFQNGNEMIFTTPDLNESTLIFGDGNADIIFNNLETAFQEITRVRGSGENPLLCPKGPIPIVYSSKLPIPDWLKQFIIEEEISDDNLPSLKGWDIRKMLNVVAETVDNRESLVGLVNVENSLNSGL